MTLVTRPFKRVLIANRGEIALRIIRTLRELGLESVAVYSDADQESLHRYQADYSVRLPGIPSSETYLNIPALIRAVQASGADAVHPGYGFLSENASFAKAVIEAGAVFIGPPPEATEIMGNKIHARNLMEAHGVPVVPGAKEPLKNADDLRLLAQRIGYPLILKAAGGGGGRGMRVVRRDQDLEDAFEACTREAIAYFGSRDVFAERYIERPRHVEFQVLFDSQGHGVYLFERDCTIQRRHQKLLEEAPSAYLSDEQRRHVGEKAIAAAKAAGYVGAGTIEFICESPERVYFMEMNTRIQVEHPVTEMITGLDLIGEQIRIARGEPLGYEQKDIRISGWAMEARINAEDPSKDFAPGPGLVQRLTVPGGPFVRVDTHLYPGYRIPDAYDSMVAKVIVWGRDRREAARRLARALADLRIEGVPTTARFHEALLRHPAFQSGEYTTRFIEEQAEYWRTELDHYQEDQGPLLAALSVIVAQEASQTEVPTPSKALSQWQRAALLEGMP
jgi:acetyl-CoA carboxylase biotin carboxylase subunit